MPRNRLPVDSAEKRAEITTAALTLFTDRGYEHTTLAQIAHAAGITPNTIYWYFGSKDDVLIAVLDEVVSEAARKYPEQDSSTIAERIFWIVTQLERYHRLIHTVHTRASTSPTIDIWHGNFHATYEGLLAAELRKEGLAQSDLGAATRLVVFVVEAMLTHPQSDDDKKSMISLLLKTSAG